MTAEEVVNRVDDIRFESGDPEAAHVHQDQLYLDVLRAIAKGVPSPAELARQAIKADEIEFPRWYA